MKKILLIILALLLFTLACSLAGTPPAPEVEPNTLGTMVALTTQPILTQSVPAAQTPPEPSLAPPPTLTDEEAIRLALLAKLGWDASELDFSIGDNSGVIARGSLKKVGEMQGAAWFAGKDNAGTWIVAYIGQGIPYCSEIQAFNFPTDWISHCIDSSGNTIAR